MIEPICETASVCCPPVMVIWYVYLSIQIWNELNWCYGTAAPTKVHIFSPSFIIIIVIVIVIFFDELFQVTFSIAVCQCCVYATAYTRYCFDHLTKPKKRVNKIESNTRSTAFLCRWFVHKINSITHSCTNRLTYTHTHTLTRSHYALTNEISTHYRIKLTWFLLFISFWTVNVGVS